MHCCGLVVGWWKGQPELVMRNIIPVVMAGVLGIYGLIVAVVLIQAGTACCPY
jgi:ATP synthase proteolipid subunit